MKKHSCISISDAIDDMQVAVDVIDPKGVCLLRAGAILTSSIIKGLMKRNIEELTIYRHVELSDEERNERLKSIIDEIDHRFSKVIDKPLMLELKSVLLEYRIREV